MPSASEAPDHLPGIVLATGEAQLYTLGEPVRILDRQPVGHYRVPTYLRGCIGVIEAVIRPAGVDNEEEGFGRNAGRKRHYYRVAVAMTAIWPGYRQGSRDSLHIEVFETWLEAIAP